MLALLLENVGIDAAVRLGDPAIWKQAIDERLKAKKELQTISPTVRSNTEIDR